jgi:NAD(P)H-hydrate epimerase
VKVVTAEEMRAIDGRCTAEYGIPSLLLMEHAGVGTVHEMERAFAGLARGPVAVLCGKGNNGGDGFVIARHLVNRGASVRTFLFARGEDLRGDARSNFEIATRMGIPVRPVLGGGDRAALAEGVAWAGLLVDALLGTGAAGAPEGLLAEAIELLNGSGKPVVAVDVPSGLGADAPAPAGPCVRATLTCTMALPKPSLLLYPGAAFAGEVRVVDIGTPRALLEDPALTRSVLEPFDVLPAFPARDPDAHKGTYGHLLVVAGSAGKSGAAALCALAGLRMGAGLVTLAAPAGLHDTLAARHSEVMVEPLPETARRTVARSALDPLRELLEGKTAVALGPGLGTQEETVEVVRRLATEVRLPMVVDADGINAFAGRMDLLARAPAPRVLTPHPGEASRLLGISRDALLRDRLALVQDVARTHSVHLVLKGARTLVADPKGSLAINPTGNPGMASGGTGDVLTGMIGGLLARGVEPGLAARAGVYLHGLAGDLAAQAVGPEALIAGDLLDQCPAALRALRGGGSAP